MSTTKTILFLIVFGALVFLGGNGLLGLTHPDEVFYSQTAKETLAHQSWLVPILFDGPNFEKPIFSYWLFMGAFQWMGVSSFSARFFPAIFALLGVLAVYGIGRIGFKDHNKAFAAAIVLMTSFLYVGLAKTVFTDMFFSVWIALSLGAFYWAYAVPKYKNLGLILACACAGFAALTKGLLGVTMPFGTIAIFLLVRKDIKFVFCPAFLLGLVIFAAIAIPWYVYVIKYYGQSFIQEFFINDHVRRILEAEHKGNDRWYFYPLTIVGTMAPWSIFVALGLGGLWQKLRQTPSSMHIFLACWIGVVFCSLQFAHSKLVSYIVPLFPAVALLAGESVAAHLNEARSRVFFVISSLAFPVIMTVAAVLAATVLGHLIPIPIQIPFVTISIFFAIVLVLTALVLWKNDGPKIRLAMIMIQVPLLLGFALSHHSLFEDFATCQSSGKFLVEQKAQGPLICSKLFLRPTRYYTDQEVVMLNLGRSKFFSPHPVRELNTLEDIQKFLRGRTASFGVVNRKQVKELQTLLESQYEVAEISVFGDQHIIRIQPKELLTKV